jgi:hypothetical protein
MSMHTTSFPGNASWSSGTVATGEAAADALELDACEALGDADVPAVQAANARIAAAPRTPFHDDRITLGDLLIARRRSGAQWLVV